MSFLHEGPVKSPQLLQLPLRAGVKGSLPPAEGCKFKMENSKDIRSHQQVQIQNELFFFCFFLILGARTKREATEREICGPEMFLAKTKLVLH